MLRRSVEPLLGLGQVQQVWFSSIDNDRLTYQFLDVVLINKIIFVGITLDRDDSLSTSEVIDSLRTLMPGLVRDQKPVSEI